MGLSESKSLLLGQTSSSCSSKGALLLVAAANGDLQVAQEILRSNPKAALFYNFKDRSSPLIQAAARGHFELVQLLLETAVMSEGPERAKRHCIDHANIKRQTALMVACKHGHPDCVEYLVTNGADPLLTDERRHNTCLHFAALYGHSECVHKLLSCRAGAGFRGQGDVQVPVARIPCINDVDGSQVQFVDGHNGWGLTALHIAVFQGSVNTVKVLLRHGASLEVVIAPPRVENSPIRCAAGSNALHIAALIGNISMAKLVLEAQEAFPGLELRAHVDSLGMRPQEYAQRARSPVLLHLLDERLPVHLLRQIWLNYSLDSGLPARHHTLASMLQKLKLMFNLEVIAIQRQLTLMDASCSKHAAQQQQQQQQQQEAVAPGSCDQAADEEGHPSCDSQVEVDRALQELLDEEHRAGGARAGAAAASAAGRASNPGLSQQQQQHQQQEDNHHQQQHLQQQQQQQLQQLQDQLQQQQTAEAAAAVAAARQQWVSQMASIESLLATIARLHSSLQGMCSREAAAAAAAAAHGVGWPPSPSPAHEAILDFILSTLITPRTVSAVLHAAKKLVSASMMHVSSSTGVLNAAGAAGACALEGPPSDTETQHSMALLTTALRAVETCLHASSQLTAPALVEKADRAAAAAVAGGAVPPATGAAASAAAAAAVGLPPRIGSGSAVSTAAASGTMPALVQQAATGTGGVRKQPNQQERAAPGAVDGSSRTGHSDAHSACAAFPTPPTQQQGMGTGAGGTADGMQHDAMSPPSSHWSSHLHTLIAQLQWDIGVQRHRRRRAHAAASAARTAAIPQAGGAVPTDSPEAVAALAAAHGRILPPSHPSTLHFLAPPAPTTLGHPPPSLVMLHHPSASPAAAAGDLGGTVEPHQEGADERGVLAEGTEGVRATDSGSHEGRRALSLEHRSPPPQHTPGSSGAAPQATHRALLHPSLQRSPSAAAAAAAAGELSSRQGRAQGVQPLEGVLGAEANSCGQACSGTTAPALPHTHARSLEVSPLATELAAQLSQESASAQDSRFTGAAASAAACMPQLKSSGSNPGQHGSRGAADCQQHTGSSLALQQALHEHDITEAAAHEAGLATASECEDDEDDGSSIGSEDDEERGMCPICMDTPISVVVSSCQHGLCVQCAFQLTVKGRELPSCPFCRQKIGGFDWTVSPLESPSASKRKTPTPKQSKA